MRKKILATVLLLVMCCSSLTVYAGPIEEEEETIQGTGWEGKNTDGSEIKKEEVVVETPSETEEIVVAEPEQPVQVSVPWVDANNVWSFSGVFSQSIQLHYLYVENPKLQKEQRKTKFLWEFSPEGFSAQVMTVNSAITQDIQNCVPSLQADMTKNLYVDYDKWTDTALVSLPHVDGFYSWSYEYIGWAMADGTVKAAKMIWNPLTASWEYTIPNFSQTFDFKSNYDNLRTGYLNSDSSICIYGANPIR